MKEQWYFMISMVIFGAVGIFARYIDCSSRKIAFYLALIGAVFWLVTVIRKKRTVSWHQLRRNRRALILSGVALSGNWIFLFQAYKETTIANAALSYYSAPIQVMVFSAILLQERLSKKKIAGVAVAFLGLTILLQQGAGISSAHHVLGIFYGLIAAVFYAALTLLNASMRDLGGLDRTIVQLGLSAIMLFPYVLVTDGLSLSGMTGNAIAMLIFLGIVHGGIGFYLFFAGMAGLGAQSIAVLSYIDPLTSLAVSVLILREGMTMLQLFGAMLVLSAIAMAERSPRTTKKQKG